MSHLWPELLRITLCPDQVILERGKLIINLKGVEARYLEPEVIPVEPRHDPTLWAAPLAVLGIALDGLPEVPHQASVILSNHFSHYPLAAGVPAGNGTQSDDIVEAALDGALRALLEQHDCQVTSLQPRIAAIGAELFDEAPGEASWLVAVEEGLACLGLIQDGEFIIIRNLCMWPASSVELLRVLDRESQAAGLSQPPRNLVLWQRDEWDEVALPFNSGWQITRLWEDANTAMPGRLLSRPLQLTGIRAQYGKSDAHSHGVEL